MRYERANGGRLLATIGFLLTLLAGAAPFARPARAQAPAAPSGLDGILKAISTYNGSIESEAFWKLRDYVYARKDDAAGRAECETKLLAFLKTPATPVAKMAASRFLRVIASEQAVPALQLLLFDDRTFDPALYALRQIPDPAVDKALLQALPKLKGPARTAAIGALGARRNPDAVADLVTLAKQPDTARAATIALGEIGGAAAAQALVAVYGGTTGEMKAVTASSILKCAEAALAAKDAGAALRLYEPLAADTSLPVPVKRAAAMGRLSAAGSGGAGLVMEYLRGPDVVLHEAAIARLSDLIAPTAVAPVCALLGNLPEASQVKLLAAIAGYPREQVLATVLQAAKSGSDPVRLAALKALEPVGDATVAPFLLETAARARGPEQLAARATLGMLKGRAVDEAILARLAGKPADDLAQELLLAVADRRIFAAKQLAAGAIGSGTPAVRAAAHKAIRAVGTLSDIPALLNVIVKTEDEAEQAEAEQTVAALARKAANVETAGAMVTSRLAREKEPKVRARLMGALPLVGDNSALPLLRRALADSDADVYDAAVRALTAWPTSAAQDDVFRLARDSRNETHRLLAIAGLVRLVRLGRYREPEAAVADLRQAAAFSWRPEELRLVLGALSQFPCDAALEVARSFLREPSLQDEARAAVDRIKIRLDAAKKAGTQGT